MNVPAAFLARVAAVLEMDAVTPATCFRETPDWCSLKAFGLLVMLENDYQARLTVDDFRAVKTVGGLYAAADLLSFAAGLFEAPPGSLTLATAYQSLPAWDSVMHLRLVMEFEKRYGVSIPLERIPGLRTLGAFLAFLAL